MLLQLFEKQTKLLHVVRFDVVHALVRVNVNPHLHVIGRDNSLANVEFSFNICITRQDGEPVKQRL